MGFRNGVQIPARRARMQCLRPLHYLFYFMLMLCLLVCLCEGSGPWDWSYRQLRELPCVYWELNPGPLEEQPVFLTTEASFSPVSVPHPTPYTLSYLNSPLNCFLKEDLTMLLKWPKAHNPPASVSPSLIGGIIVP